MGRDSTAAELGQTARAFVALLVGAALFATPAPSGAAAADEMVSVIVRGAEGATAVVDELVEQVGGSVTGQLGLIGGVVAEVPSSGLDALRSLDGIVSVTPDATVRLLDWENASAITDYEPEDYPGSMHRIAQEITGAAEFWNDGFTGAGVDVALIDSGVAPVNGLTFPGKVVNGPDLSFESQAPNLTYLDSYGHGTHMAGIIAGRDDSATGQIQKGDDTNFLGMAPGARIVSVKIADAHGAVDVSQVIAAVDWVIQHKNADGLNIRVLNLSFGTDGTQSYVLDPLAFAVEQAWKAGIVVVIAAGNDGNGAHLRNPALNPFVIAVGAADGAGTYGSDDDSVAQFSNCGTHSRHVDIVAPGKSVISLRAPGSYSDETAPSAVVADRFFLGSGTSQAAAVVAGAAALVIDQRPTITPNKLKRLLINAAQDLDEDERCQGAGMLDLKEARDRTTPSDSQSEQHHSASHGRGSLEASRGDAHVFDNGVPLEGERDIMGELWGHVCDEDDDDGDGDDDDDDGHDDDDDGHDDGDDGDDGDDDGDDDDDDDDDDDECDDDDDDDDAGSWLFGASWSGASWSGASWSGASWSGASWSGASWSGASWSGASWSAKTWSGASWSGASWSGASWSGASWSGSSWASDVWHGLSWKTSVI